MKCLRCGVENRENYIKCRKCGQVLDKQTPKENVIAETLSYNWIPAASVVVSFVLIILILKILFRF